MSFFHYVLFEVFFFAIMVIIAVLHSLKGEKTCNVHRFTANIIKSYPHIDTESDKIFYFTGFNILLYVATWVRINFLSFPSFVVMFSSSSSKEVFFPFVCFKLSLKKKSFHVILKRRFSHYRPKCSCSKNVYVFLVR